MFCAELSLFELMKGDFKNSVKTSWGSLCDWRVFCMPILFEDHYQLAVFDTTRQNVRVYDSLSPTFLSPRLPVIKEAVQRYSCYLKSTLLSLHQYCLVTRYIGS